MKSQLEKQRAHLREEHKMEIATLNDKVRMYVYRPGALGRKGEMVYYPALS